MGQNPANFHGHFKLDGIPPAPRGIPQVEVAFDIDVNGILDVTAKDLGTGKVQSVKIESSSGISEAEIEKMKQDAEQHADEDKTRKDEAEVKNQAEQLEYQVRKLVKESGDKIPDDDKRELEQAGDAVKAALESKDVNKIRTEKQNLEERMKKASEVLYQAAAAQQPDGQVPPGAVPPGGVPPTGEPQHEEATTGSDDSVIDADYTVKDDETSS